MREQILNLDSKGILPKSSDSEIDYLRRGIMIMGHSRSPEFIEYLKENKVILQQFIGKFENVHLSSKTLKDFYKKYHCSMEWVNAFKGYDLEDGQGKLIKIMYHNVVIPVIVQYYNYDIKTIFPHQLSHVVRINFFEKENLFENIYGNNFFFLNINKKDPLHKVFGYWKKIRNAEKKLEDVVGDSNRYISIRLKEDELRKIADTKINIKDYLKSQRTLRHRIILERLGL